MRLTAVQDSKWFENFLWWLAMHLPKRLDGYVYIRVATSGTVGKYSDTVLPELTIVEAYRRWFEHYEPEEGKEIFTR